MPDTGAPNPFYKYLQPCVKHSYACFLHMPMQEGRYLIQFTVNQGYNSKLTFPFKPRSVSHYWKCNSLLNCILQSVSP